MRQGCGPLALTCGAAALTILVAALTRGAVALVILVAALTCGASALTSFVAALTCGATALTSFVALQVEYTGVFSVPAARASALSAARANVRVTFWAMAMGRPNVRFSDLTKIIANTRRARCCWPMVAAAQRGGDFSAFAALSVVDGAWMRAIQK